jgi:thioredoxin-like negative regulator of GroEL
VLSATTTTYATAHERTSTTGEPLVVLVGADWCPACQQMKSNIIPQAERNGLLSRVSFAVVNTDHEPGLARRLMRGGTIPQLIMYHKTADGGWKRSQLTGAQSVDSLRTFLAQPAADATSPKVSQAPRSGETIER